MVNNGKARKTVAPDDLAARGASRGVSHHDDSISFSPSSPAPVPPLLDGTCDTEHAMDDYGIILNQQGREVSTLGLWAEIMFWITIGAAAMWAILGLVL